MSVSLANNVQASNQGGGAPMVSIPSVNIGSPVTSQGIMLSPNRIKTEPKFVMSPCNAEANVFRLTGGNHVTDRWMTSPTGGQMPSPSAIASSPRGLTSPRINGQVNGSMSIPNGYSPHSSSSYDPYSPTNGKEDMSPPNSLNGYHTQLDNFGDSKSKKKGPAPRQQEELCLVCGDRASGYHYNALTCEGCKGFFRRSITKDAVYQCKYGNHCEIDMYMRRKCQQCRLKKCLAVGMRPECVVPEYQCAMKRESKKAQKDKDKPNSTTRGDPYPSSDHHHHHHIMQKEVASPVPVSSRQNDHHHSNNNNNNNSSTGSVVVVGGSGNQIKPISTEQEELINRLVYFQEEFESPSEDDLKTVTEFPLGNRSEDGDRRLKHVTEITILTVQLIVEFSKRLPGFDTLLREDQITLLKACSSEVMMLRCARKYDINTDSVVFANNQPYTRENYFSASVGDSADAIFGFCKHLCLMKVDNAEFALLTALVIFSERPSLVEPKKVEKIQEIYVDALKTYIDNHHQSKHPQKFARLLTILTELRSLGNANLEMCFSLKVKNKNLPAFLAEIWDIQT